jgi:hypothetical protein
MQVRGLCNVKLILDIDRIEKRVDAIILQEEGRIHHREATNSNHKSNKISLINQAAK